MGIKIEDLTVTFRNHVIAINHADLEIPKGIFGLLGENGAGKPKHGERAAAGEKLNVARMLYIGCKLLNFSENEIFMMTIRKFFLIYNEYLELNGLKKREMTIDEMP